MSELEHVGRYHINRKEIMYDSRHREDGLVDIAEVSRWLVSHAFPEPVNTRRACVSLWTSSRGPDNARDTAMLLVHTELRATCRFCTSSFACFVSWAKIDTTAVSVQAMLFHLADMTPRSMDLTKKVIACCRYWTKDIIA